MTQRLVQKAEGRREESLQNKGFNLFQLDSYFSHAVLEAKARESKI
jgi:hypothetical protein